MRYLLTVNDGKTTCYELVKVHPSKATALLTNIVPEAANPPLEECIEAVMVVAKKLKVFSTREVHRNITRRLRGPAHTQVRKQTVERLLAEGKLSKVPGSRGQLRITQ